jgi:hypothetical protein
LSGLRLVLVLFAGATLSGCVAGAARPSGAIFSRTIEPLDLNFNNTPVHSQRADEGANTLQYYVRVDWGSFAPGEVAKSYGFSEIHYADLETLSVLGFFTRRTVHVYGQRGAP